MDPELLKIMAGIVLSYVLIRFIKSTRIGKLVSNLLSIGLLGAVLYVVYVAYNIISAFT
ncbi:hypothetical protein [Butyrivibrio proteoclasticus]|uniref:hypothetical protein n=1 Tax=Butyrivibrio proteoclasticus TaxID=43305 RepID=UPI000A4A835F|nr:hypothetical protein [Butyrivibrio proteoclasticus]